MAYAAGSWRTDLLRWGYFSVRKSKQTFSARSAKVNGVGNSTHLGKKRQSKLRPKPQCSSDLIQSMVKNAHSFFFGVLEWPFVVQFNCRFLEEVVEDTPSV
jgi:hypothetical protein